VTAINSATIGQANPGTIKQQFSILTKYTFTDGVVKGLSIGAGFASSDKALQGYVLDAATNKLLARYNPSTINLDAFATYRFKAFGRKQSIQFNVKNLTEQGEFTGWKPTGSKALATQRYEVPVSRRFELSYGIEL
jgi:outer membrane receptor for monomeric catechols